MTRRWLTYLGVAAAWVAAYFAAIAALNLLMSLTGSPFDSALRLPLGGWSFVFGLLLLVGAAGVVASSAKWDHALASAVIIIVVSGVLNPPTTRVDSDSWLVTLFVAFATTIGALVGLAIVSEADRRRSELLTAGAVALWLPLSIWLSEVPIGLLVEPILPAGGYSPAREVLFYLSISLLLAVAAIVFALAARRLGASARLTRIALAAAGLSAASYWLVITLPVPLGSQGTLSSVAGAVLIFAIPAFALLATSSWEAGGRASACPTSASTRRAEGLG